MEARFFLKHNMQLSQMELFCHWKSPEEQEHIGAFTLQNSLYILWMKTLERMVYTDRVETGIDKEDKMQTDSGSKQNITTSLTLWNLVQLITPSWKRWQVRERAARHFIGNELHSQNPAQGIKTHTHAHTRGHAGTGIHTETCVLSSWGSDGRLSDNALCLSLIL